MINWLTVINIKKDFLFRFFKPETHGPLIIKNIFANTLFTSQSVKGNILKPFTVDKFEQN